MQICSAGSVAAWSRCSFILESDLIGKIKECGSNHQTNMCLYFFVHFYHIIISTTCPKSASAHTYKEPLSVQPRDNSFTLAEA